MTAATGAHAAGPTSSSTPGRRPLRFALCEVVDQEKWRGYTDSIWRQRLGFHPDDTFELFACHQGRFPDPADCGAKYDVVVVGGSPYSVYDDIPWIRQLQALVPRYAASSARVLGCCFGHQMLAQGLGGRVTQNPSGRFVLGIEAVQMDVAALQACGLAPEGLVEDCDRPAAATAAGAAAPAAAAAGPGCCVPACRLRLVESHGDQVVTLPQGATPLAASGTAQYEMLLYGSNVLSFQFHPEMEPSLALEKIWPALTANGRLSAEESAAAQQQLQHGANDSRAVLELVRRFLEDGAKPAAQQQQQQQHRQEVRSAAAAAAAGHAARQHCHAPAAAPARWRPLRFAVLDAEDSAKWRGYTESLWRKGLGFHPNDTFEAFACHQGRFPELAECGTKYDVLLLGGSHYSAYDDEEWIRQLEVLLPQYATSPARLIACCFGHQLLAQAMGGQVAKNPSGRFVLGIEDVQLDAPGLQGRGLPLPEGAADAADAAAAAPSAGPAASSSVAAGTPAAAAVPAAAPPAAGPSPCVPACACRLRLVESHGDQVVTLPQGATPLAASGTAQYEMLLYGSNVLSFQFHPEMEPSLALEKIWPALTANGRLSADESAAAAQQLQHGANDSRVFLELLRRFAEEGAQPATAHRQQQQDPVQEGGDAGSAAAAAGPAAPHAALAARAASAAEELLVHARAAAVAGLQEGVASVDLIARMNRAAAAQYAAAADAAGASANKLCQEEVAGRQVPMQTVLHTLEDLERQLDRLVGVVNQLDSESQQLERQLS